MIKATPHNPPLTHADLKVQVLGLEGSAVEENSESKSYEQAEKKAGMD